MGRGEPIFLTGEAERPIWISEMKEGPTLSLRKPKHCSPMLPGDVDNNPKDIGFWALLAEDFRTHDRHLLEPGFWAVAVQRFGNWRMGVRPKLLRAPFSILYKLLFRFIELGFGITLPYNTVIGRRLRIWHHGGIFVGARSIGDDVHLRHNVTIGVVRRGENEDKPVIGNRVDIGPGAAILGAIEVGDDVVVGANSVVLRDVPPDSVVLGVPARSVKLTAAHKGQTLEKSGEV
jgi:serine O-acetyltransferase